MAIPAEAKDCGMRPWWGGYVGSADVDADAERLAQAGGKVMRAPEDIPGVGRFAVMADPGGAIFMLLKGSSPDGMEPAPPMANGHIGWHELYSGNFDADLNFYMSQFGWAKGEAMDMGEMGSYQLVSQTGGSDFQSMTGGIMPRPKEVPVPVWLFYFVVPDIDVAAEKVRAGGGTVLNGPMEVPGGGWILQAADPQGAMFALVGSRISAN
jgi:predicted enzyme related to lactoylglutathione lyase